MATTSLHSLPFSFSLYSSSSSSSSSYTFKFPKKCPQISCFLPKAPIFVHPIGLPHLDSGFSHVVPTHTQKSSSLYGKPAVSRDLVVAQATEVVAPTSVEQSTSQTKSSKKKKKEYPRRFLDMYQVLQYPIITEAAVKNIAEENSLLFTVDVRADKKMIKEAVKNLFGLTARKVNTSIRPDGTKKAHIMLSKEYNASDLAKKIGIFPSSG